MFKVALFYLSGGPWKVFYFFLCTVFFVLFCYYSYKRPWWQDGNVSCFHFIILANAAGVRFVS